MMQDREEQLGGATSWHSNSALSLPSPSREVVNNGVLDLEFFQRLQQKRRLDTLLRPGTENKAKYVSIDGATSGLSPDEVIS